MCSTIILPIINELTWNWTERVCDSWSWSTRSDNPIIQRLIRDTTNRAISPTFAEHVYAINPLLLITQQKGTIKCNHSTVPDTLESILRKNIQNWNLGTDFFKILKFTISAISKSIGTILHTSTYNNVRWSLIMKTSDKKYQKG